MLVWTPAVDSSSVRRSGRVPLVDLVNLEGPEVGEALSAPVTLPGEGVEGRRSRETSDGGLSLEVGLVELLLDVLTQFAEIREEGGALPLAVKL